MYHYYVEFYYLLSFIVMRGRQWVEFVIVLSIGPLGC